MTGSLGTTCCCCCCCSVEAATNVPVFVLEIGSGACWLGDGFASLSRALLLASSGDLTSDSPEECEYADRILDSDSEGDGGPCEAKDCCWCFCGGGGGFAGSLPMGRRGMAIFGGPDGGLPAASRCNGGSDGGKGLALAILVERGGGGGSSLAGGRRGKSSS